MLLGAQKDSIQCTFWSGVSDIWLKIALSFVTHNSHFSFNHNQPWPLQLLTTHRYYQASSNGFLSVLKIFLTNIPSFYDTPSR